VRDWIKPPCRASWPEPSQPNPCRAGKGPTPARTTRPAAIAVSSRSRGKATTAFDHHNNALPPANTFSPTVPFDQASLGPPVSPNIAHQALPDSVKPRSRFANGSHGNHANHFLHYTCWRATSVPTMGAAMITMGVSVPFLGQLERSPDGLLWVVLYRGTAVIHKEPVRSRRRGRSRLIDIVLTASEPFPAGLDRRPLDLDPCTRRIRTRREERGSGT